jgi:hypothetical protein
MENKHLKRIEITNENLPVELRNRLEYLQDEIFEFEKVIFWLRVEPGGSEPDLSLIRKIKRSIEKARKHINSINDARNVNWNELKVGSCLFESKAAVFNWYPKLLIEFHDKR